MRPTLAEGVLEPSRRPLGPWRVWLEVRWTPVPRLAPGFALVRRWRVATVGSYAAALAAAREAFEHRVTSTTGAVGPADPGVHVVTAVAADPLGRVVLRAGSVADVRDAARRLAGWVGPAPARPPPVATTPPLPAPPDAPTGRDAGRRPEARARSGRDGLTAAQRAVVGHPGGAAVVLAVAGAGKTTTMVARVRALVGRGVSPPAILVTSFSRAAVHDLRGRLAAAGVDPGVEVRTLHAMAYAVLHERARASPLGRRAALTDPARAAAPGSPAPDAVVPRLVSEVLRDLRARGREPADDVDVRAFAAYRGRLLARLALPDVEGWGATRPARRLLRPAFDDPDAEAHREVAEAVERLRLQRGWLDFDAAIVHALLAVLGDDALRGRLHARWRHVLVDEFQDVNPAQVALLEAVLAPEAEVMAIGDDDQSIYAFRGSDPSLLAAFGRRHHARTYVLDDNFRGRPETLAAAAELVGGIAGRSPKRLRAARPLGGSCTSEAHASAEDEARALAERVAATRRDRPAWTQAVLLRSYAQAPDLEEALLRAGVPYRILGAASVDRSDATRTALAALHLLAAEPSEPSVRAQAVRARAWRRWLRGVAAAPDDAGRQLPRVLAAEEALARAGPPPGTIGDVEPLALRALRASADRSGGERLRPLVEALATTAAAVPDGAVAAVRAARGTIGRWPRRDAASRGLEAVLRCAEAGVWGDPAAPPGAFLASLRAWRAATAAAPWTLLVTSAHRSKGLEWDVVHVPGQSLGTFPRSIDDDERRLAYVAWTRARERLHLSRAHPSTPAPFLAEGGVDELVRLQDDLAWLAATPDAPGPAPRWAHAEALLRLGAAPAVPGTPAAPAAGAPKEPAAPAVQRAPRPPPAAGAPKEPPAPAVDSPGRPRGGGRPRGTHRP